MFTGLIETIGTIISARPWGNSVELRIRPDASDYTVGMGGSVAVDGACLTLERTDSDGNMHFTAVAETMNRTTLAKIGPGRRVNLERAVRADSRLDGHIVQGHIDAVGKIIADKRSSGGVELSIEIPGRLAPFTAEKGSIAVDGISLTIAEASHVNIIRVALIPETLKRTTLSKKGVGDFVNIECDVLAKYIRRMLEVSAHYGGPGLESAETLLDKLGEAGF
jgi:riboflavin synthase